MEELEEVLTDTDKLVRIGISSAKERSDAEKAFVNIRDVCKEIRALYQDTSPEARKIMTEFLLESGETAYMLALKRARAANSLAQSLVQSMRTEMVIGRAGRLDKATVWLERVSEEPALLTVSNKPTAPKPVFTAAQGSVATVVVAMIGAVGFLAGGCSGSDSTPTPTTVTVTKTADLPRCTIARKLSKENKCA